MKKQRAKKLRLNRETLRALEENNLQRAVGAAIVKGSFIKPCTYVVSDCYPCTGVLDTCPSAQNCPSAPPQCGVA